MHTRGSGPSYNSKASGSVNAKRKAAGGNKSVSRNKPTGKKGNASSSVFSGTPDLEINEENMSFYKAMQAKLKAEKKAAAASQDEAIRKRNKALMDAEANEEDGFEEDNSPRAKRIRTEAIGLDDEEAEIASGLHPIHETSRAASQLEQDKTRSHDVDSVGAEGEGEDEDEGEGEGEGSIQGGGAVDDYSGDGHAGFEDNGMALFEFEDRTATPPLSQRSRSRSLTPWLSSDSKLSNSSKVREGDFSPNTRRLAIASKAHVRTTAIYNTQGPFLPTSRMSRMDFAWSTIKETSKNSGDPIMNDALSRATNNDSIKKQLITFTMYGRSALLSNVINKARERVRGFYGISGISDKIREDIEWLLMDSKFMYGDINLEKRTYDAQKPFGSPLIAEIIESQWFSTSSRSNADVATTTKIVAERAIPLSIIILILTVIEHSLKEWSNGRKANKISFSEDIAKQSYGHHLGNWNMVAKKAPRWAKFWQNELAKQILSQHNAFLDDANQGKDIANLDFAALDKLAEDWEGEPGEGTD